MKSAPTPSATPSYVELVSKSRLSRREKAELIAAIERAIQEEKHALGPSKEIQDQARRIKEKAHLCGFRITSAESMTGGSVFKCLTSVPGGRKATETGAIIAYSSEAKQELLNVPGHVLDKYSAVSTQTAKHMALHAMENTDADIAVSVTGFAGPSLAGYTFSKPPGTVVIGVAFQPDSKDTAQVEAKEYRAGQYNLSGVDREQDIRAATQLALNALEEMLDRHIEKHRIDINPAFMGTKEKTFLIRQERAR